MSLIQLKNIVKSFMHGPEKIEVLKSLDLTIAKGELLAILGTSGSGKSTLLHLLGCLDRPTSGSYHFDSHDINALNDDHLAHFRAHKIGFVFQAYNLIPQLNVYDNVALPFYYQKRYAQIDQKIKHSIEMVGMSHRLHHSARLLSGGEMQRVAIARALAIDPLLILADEPTGNLDQQNCAKILQLLHELNRQGTTVIIVTHDLEIAKHCRRTILIQNGVINRDECHEKF